MEEPSPASRIRRHDLEYVLLCEASQCLCWISRWDVSRILSCADLAVGFTQAHLIADQLFDQLADQHQHSPDTPEITLHTDWIKWIAQAILSNRTRNVPTRINIAQLVRAKEFPIIILVAGTSGSGKSSVAARLSERLSILSLLSTDSIREQLRTIQSFNEQEYPALHVSTYETHKVVGEELKSESKLLCGYKRQCDIVMKSIPHILQKRMNSKIPTIVEGVHLSAEHIKEIIEKCPNSLIFSFCIYVSEQNVHKERFASRSEGRNIDAEQNKYIKNFGNIREIQDFLLSECSKIHIPLIDNKNVIDSTVDEIMSRLWCMIEWLALNRYDRFKECGVELRPDCFPGFQQSILSKDDEMYLNKLYN